NQPIARAQVQMIGVAEDDLGADVLEIAMGDGLDRSAGAHRHEGRRLHDTVPRPQLPATGRPFARGDGEAERGHLFIIALGSLVSSVASGFSRTELRGRAIHYDG